MTDDTHQTDDRARPSASRSPGLLPEMLDFARHHKRWWLLPIIGMLLLAGAIALLSGSAAVPFVYALF